MSAMDLQFKISGSLIDEPQEVDSTTITITLINQGDDDLADIGLYISPANITGDIDFPADYPPETDYQDLLTWGTNTDAALVVSGGLLIENLSQNMGTFDGYITRTAGADIATKIEVIDLASGDSTDFDVTFETPPGEPARRFYVTLMVS